MDARRESSSVALNAVSPLALARPVTLVSVPCGLGAPDPRCGAGPVRLVSGGLPERLAARGVEMHMGSTVCARDARGRSVYGVIAELCGQLAMEVKSILNAGGLPVVLGGDHSCAIGTWSGVASALASKGPIGLVWIDAHMDSHTFATSPSGRPHGMPLAALLGRGADPKMAKRVHALAHEGPILPQHVCVVGVRSYEPEEELLLRELGLVVFSMEEVARRGCAVIEDAVALASTGTAGYGISIDLDAIDPLHAPGVGSPVAGGLDADGLITALGRHAGDPRLVGLEVVEYNPHLDPEGKTADVVEEILAAVLGGSPQRPRPQ